MTALGFLRSSRRLSGALVAVLLILGAAGSFHHHRLDAPSHAVALETPSDAAHPSRSVDCVVCRTVDPVCLVFIHQNAPPAMESVALDESILLFVAASSSRSFSPRAPPAVA